MLHIITQAYPDILSVIQTEISGWLKVTNKKDILHKMTEFFLVISRKPKNEMKAENEWKTGFT